MRHTFNRSASMHARHRFAALAAVAMLMWGAAVPAGAQETREEERAKKQAEKAAAVQPPAPNKAERIAARIQNSTILGGAPAGFYPVFGTIYPGGWLAFGAGYRKPYADTGAVNLSGAWSLRNFKTAELSVMTPRMVNDMLSFEAKAHYLDAPNVAFYGIGMGSHKDDKTTFGYEPKTVGITARFHPKYFTAGWGIDYLDIKTSEGSGTKVPSIETLFPVLPGLGTSPTYIRSRGFAQFDWRRPPGYSGTGGLYRIEVQNYEDRDDLDVGFRSFEGEVVQLIPLMRANWVIALRGMVTITDTSDGNVVPYYMLPALGGSRSLRGFTSFRYRGNHRLLTTIEYRWTPARFMDMAIFYDMGKVVDDSSDLDFDGLKSSYGFGARIHGPVGTVLRWELARSNEIPFRFIWAAGAAF